MYVVKYYLIIINIISFIIYGLDKFYAIKHKNRVSEFRLLFMSFIGGVIGSLLGMILFRHKIIKIKFWILNIIYLIMWISLAIKFC